MRSLVLAAVERVGNVEVRVVVRADVLLVRRADRAQDIDLVVAGEPLQVEQVLDVRPLARGVPDARVRFFSIVLVGHFGFGSGKKLFYLPISMMYYPDSLSVFMSQSRRSRGEVEK